MAVPAASNNATPCSDANKGAKHQRVHPPANAQPSVPGLPVPVAVVLGGGVPGQAYSETLTAQGGTSPYTYTLASGALPAGTTLSTAGVISGTPSTAATYTFTIQAQDALGSTGSQNFSITIAATSGGRKGFAYVA